jgi:mono/diheme cytochrome c family protein
VAALPDRYFADLIRHGGASFGKPGMPSFGFILSDTEIDAVIQYVRTLPRVPRDVATDQHGPTRPSAAPDRRPVSRGS